MGESSACLVRSFSQPSPTSSEEKKGNPIQRALTTSVSFGRFMSESLDWEKWSAFTHNRYLEEVEKYSRPGSVAEKKAYFEAHFKRRRAAALLEQQNAATSNLPETNTDIDVKDNSSSDLKSDLRDSYPVIKNTKDGGIENSNLIFSDGQNDSYAASIENEEVTQLPVLTESPVELTKFLESDEGDIMSNKDNKASSEDDSNKINLASLSEKKSEVTSSKLSTNAGASECAPPTMPSQIRNSVNTQDSKKLAKESSNKRRSYTTSLHMSINFASCSQKAKSPNLLKIANPRLIRAPVKKYKNSTVPQTSTRASANVIFKHHLAAPSAENKRMGTPHCGSNSIRTVDFKVKSQSANYSKPNTFEGTARLPTTSSPFTFKSEERAAKRKEFFQKLEQKFKSRETETHERHAKSQVKATNAFKNLRNSIVAKATKNAEIPCKVELPCNLTRKIPTVRPSFSKIEERTSFKVHNNDSRPPWRLSVKREGLKDVTGKTCHPSAKCFSKRSDENASPNIQV